jgi:predicted nucleotidyltransferase
VIAVRISEEHRALIRRLTAEYLGSDARVRVFGSRIDDSKRGGDIDLLVEVPKILDSPVMTGARLAARLERALEGRKVDVLLVDPTTVLQPVHHAALRSGVML